MHVQHDLWSSRYLYLFVTFLKYNCRLDKQVPIYNEVVSRTLRGTVAALIFFFLLVVLILLAVIHKLRKKGFMICVHAYAELITSQLYSIVPMQNSVSSEMIGHNVADQAADVQVENIACDIELNEDAHAKLTEKFRHETVTAPVII